MTARFIVSLDCEGKWGVADTVSQYHQQYFTDKNLIVTYKKLLSLFEKYEIKVTFAFTGAFSLSFDAYQAYRHELQRDILINGTPWLSRFHKEIKVGNTEGWFGSECYEIVQKREVHEIAAHGFTHLPLSEDVISLQEFQHEMTLINKYAPYGKDANLTFVYPRNQTGYVSNLSASGFIGFRDFLKNKKNGKIGKIYSLMDEVNIFTSADQPLNSGSPVAIPAGKFLNWRNGFRQKIPLWVTIKRWENMLSNAIENNGILHLWSHPHNFIDGNNMFFLLEKILEKISKAQSCGEIVNVTQREYCSNALENS